MTRFGPWTEHKWRSLGTKTVPDQPDEAVVYVDEGGIVQVTYEVLAQMLRELGWIEQPKEPTP